MKKKILYCILFTILIHAVLYYAISFIKLEFNIKNWSEDLRVIFVTWGAILSFLYSLLFIQINKT